LRIIGKWNNSKLIVEGSPFEVECKPGQPILKSQDQFVFHRIQVTEMFSTELDIFDKFGNM